MTWVNLPDAAAYVPAMVPPGPIVVVTLFARVSPSGKLTVELVGLLTGRGVIDRNPAAVCETTVTFPVIATAFAGTGEAPKLAIVPVTLMVFAVLAGKRPLTLTLPRVSRMRAGVIGTYVAPSSVFSGTMFVVH